MVLRPVSMSSRPCAGDLEVAATGPEAHPATPGSVLRQPFGKTALASIPRANQKVVRGSSLAVGVDRVDEEVVRDLVPPLRPGRGVDVCEVELPVPRVEHPWRRRAARESRVCWAVGWAVARHDTSCAGASTLGRRTKRGQRTKKEGGAPTKCGRSTVAKAGAGAEHTLARLIARVKHEVACERAAPAEAVVEIDPGTRVAKHNVARDVVLAALCLKPQSIRRKAIDGVVRQSWQGVAGLVAAAPSSQGGAQAAVVTCTQPVVAQSGVGRATMHRGVRCAL